MIDKKYHSISAAAQILGAKEHNLRHLDHIFGKKLTIIRGRRYYKTEDLEILRNAMSRKISKVEKDMNFVNDGPIEALMKSMLSLRAELFLALRHD